MKVWGIALIFGILGLLVSCASPDALEAGAQERPKDIYERYALELSQAEAAYRRGDVVELSRLVSSLLDYELPESPNYRPYFFVSYLKYTEGDRRGSAEMLRDFKCMLRVDSGTSQCFSDASNDQLSQLCADAMCSEIFLSHYEKPTEENLKMIARYWSFVDDLEAKLGGSVGNCGE